MIAYKLCRKLKTGEITPLYINRILRLPFDIWLNAENHPTKGYAIRPYWHVCETPNAPHLSKKDRVWVEVEIEDYEEFERPENQGGKWFLAKRIKFLREMPM